MTEQAPPDSVDSSLNTIVLDIKALMLLATDRKNLNSKIITTLVESHDESVQEFVKQLTPEKKEKMLPLLVTAIGELILTAFLLLLGLSIVTPVLVGGTGPEYLIHYFGTTEASIAGNPTGASLVMILNLLLSILLLFSALYSLGRVAKILKTGGLQM